MIEETDTTSRVDREYLKLVLVQPRWTINSLWEDLGSAYISAYLKSKLDIQIDHYSGAFDSDDDIVVGCADADYVGFGCTSPQMKHALRLASLIKQKNPSVETIFGGYHPSALPVDTYRLPNVDYVVAGEGEEGMLRLLSGETTDLVIHSERLDINSLPFPDREVIRNYRHVDFTERVDGKRITSIQSARGCAFHCQMCSNSVVHTRMVRERSAKSVMDEFDQVADEFRIDFMKFRDASWNTSKRKVMEFCAEKLRRGNALPWGANIHASIVDREMLESMRQVGCEEVWLGVESGSQQVLNSMCKGLHLDQVRRVFKMTKEMGFLRRAYFMLGYPTETLADILLTERLVDEIQPDKVGFSICVPFPGTPLYREEYSGTDWSRVDEYGNDIWGSTISNRALLQIQRHLTLKYEDKLAGRKGVAGE